MPKPFVCAIIYLEFYAESFPVIGVHIREREIGRVNSGQYARAAFGRVFMRFVLASASPRRREILTRLGYEFTVRCSNAPEDDVTGELADVVTTLARRKAESVAKIETDALVIAADTLVGLDGKKLGKPRDEKDAFEMLKLLSANTHEVTTGICLINTETGKSLSSSDTTRVEFRALTDEEISAYIATGEPMDKAGSYAIQGGAAAFVKRYTGSYDNIVGFPSELFERLVKRIL